MLGHVVYKLLDEIGTYKLCDISYRNKLNPRTIICDVTNSDELEKIIVNLKPDIIINCIGVLIQGTAKSIERAIFLNAYFPHWLKNLCDTLDSKLIHISTDCVFSGLKGENSEETTPDAKDIYGKTKALGEFNSDKHLCLRTSIIGPELKKEGEGLLHWVFNQKGKIAGYSRVYWSGVTTLELAKAMSYAIDHKVSGLWNFTNGEKINKFELLNLIRNTFSLEEIILFKESKKVSDKSLITKRKLSYKVPSYEVMINDLKEFYLKNKYIYDSTINN